MECDRYFVGMEIPPGLSWRAGPWRRVQSTSHENGHEGTRSDLDRQENSLYRWERMLGWQIPRVSDLPNSQFKLGIYYVSLVRSTALKPPPKMVARITSTLLVDIGLRKGTRRAPPDVLVYHVIEANSRLASFNSSG